MPSARTVRRGWATAAMGREFTVQARNTWLVPVTAYNTGVGRPYAAPTAPAVVLYVLLNAEHGHERGTGAGLRTRRRYAIRRLPSSVRDGNQNQKAIGEKVPEGQKVLLRAGLSTSPTKDPSGKNKCRSGKTFAKTTSIAADQLFDRIEGHPIPKSTKFRI